jgi:hypothetical protein
MRLVTLNHMDKVVRTRRWKGVIDGKAMVSMYKSGLALSETERRRFNLSEVTS